MKPFAVLCCAILLYVRLFCMFPNRRYVQSYASTHYTYYEVSKLHKGILSPAICEVSELIKKCQWDTYGHIHLQWNYAAVQVQEQ